MHYGGLLFLYYNDLYFMLAVNSALLMGLCYIIPLALVFKFYDCSVIYHQCAIVTIVPTFKILDGYRFAYYLLQLVQSWSCLYRCPT